jgi:hypothetical protein
VVDGYVSLAAAYERYGVVLDPATLALDAAGTERRRQALRQGRAQKER